ncbi:MULTISPECIES: adenylate/guanylate cyclase domain-containing protein [Brevibacterium]|uniref:adenylate/guanylate cyclase domain-containing protein n=1 Tax=Brevibacterium TaxID=1696 RepID=UPI0022B7BD5F|nr:MULTISPECIES: adenylate/guanylate cyclase domain-containing protein [Brevibacterium]
MSTDPSRQTGTDTAAVEASAAQSSATEASPTSESPTPAASAPPKPEVAPEPVTPAPEPVTPAATTADSAPATSIGDSTPAPVAPASAADADNSAPRATAPNTDGDADEPAHGATATGDDDDVSSLHVTAQDASAQAADADEPAHRAAAEDHDHGRSPQATADAELPATSVMPVIRSAESGEDDDASESNTTAHPTGKPKSSDFFGGLHEDPRTSALSIVDEDTDDDPIYETRSAAERLEEILLDGKRVLDRREAAKLGGISTVSARKMWRALGMSQTDEHDKAYTVSDAHALRMWAKPVADGLIDQETALSLARAIGQTTDRLVVWQMETLVEYLTEEKGMSEPEARREALEVIEDLIDPMQKMLVYSWRRNLAEVMGRLNVNVSDGLAMDNRQGWYDSSMPLARAVGFIDLVSYTRLSQKLEPRQLANMVQEFQGICYNIVATGGGRIIKTVGDEVFFAAETPMAGAEIAMTLMERVTAAADLPQARVGFVWGRVLSRLGDIFGSSVNLAARLTAVAEPGTIFTDEETARVLSTSDAYVFEPRGSLTLQGLGETGICQMLRGTAARMKLDLDDES